MKNLSDRVKEFLSPIIPEKLANLYPPQKKALESGFFSKGRNLLLCTGTGSGKTLIAEIAAVSTVLDKGKKVLYITPLRALSGEKYAEFKKYSPRIRSAISIGGLDEEDGFLGGKDVVFLTTEKLDALMRHQVDWLSDVGLLIIDEIHEIGSDRGPTLESVIVKLRTLSPTAQILALSATVGNSEEVAKWLSAELIRSDFRPVPLREGVIVGDSLEFLDGERATLPEEGEIGAALDCARSGNQSLVFLNTRRSAEKTAEEISERMRFLLKEEEKRELALLSEKVLNALSSPTPQCERLASCILKGTAFHHAGLVHGQKILVEDAFRKGLVRCLSATVTLVAGMNLPARRIIIRGLTSWGEDGPRDWPVSLYKQAAGRAGRAGYDRIGESVVIAKGRSEAALFVDKYLNGTPEEIYSGLGNAPVLRREILGAIASGFAGTVSELLGFFSRTFYAHQYGDITRIHATIQRALEELREWEFLEKAEGNSQKTGGGFQTLAQSIRAGGEKERKEQLILTKLGKRVAELYIDPLSAREILKSLRGAKSAANPFAYLFLVSNTFELRPFPSVKAKEEEKVWTEISRRKTFLERPPEPWDIDAEMVSRSFKLALALEAWVGEVDDREIMDKFGIAPGDLRMKLMNADWVCYSACEIAKVAELKEHYPELAKMRMRLEHGVKEELLRLILLKGIGRARARKLYAAGLKNPEAVLNTERKKLASLVGEKLADKLLSKD